MKAGINYDPRDASSRQQVDDRAAYQQQPGDGARDPDEHETSSPDTEVADASLDDSSDEDREEPAGWETTHQTGVPRPSVRRDTLSRRPQAPATGLSRLRPWFLRHRQPTEETCHFDGDDDVEVVPRIVEPEVVYENEETGYSVDGWFIPSRVERHQRDDWTWEQRHPVQARVSGYLQRARQLPLVQDAEQHALAARITAQQVYGAAAARARGPARTAWELAIVTGQVTHWLGSLAITHSSEMAIHVGDRIARAVQARMPAVEGQMLRLIQERMPLVMPAQMPLVVRRPDVAVQFLIDEARVLYAAGYWREYRDLLRMAFRMLPPLESHLALGQGRRRR